MKKSKEENQKMVYYKEKNLNKLEEKDYNSGITLVALVVTIIVLLILARSCTKFST